MQQAERGSKHRSAEEHSDRRKDRRTDKERTLQLSNRHAIARIRVHRTALLGIQALRQQEINCLHSQMVHCIEQRVAGIVPAQVSAHTKQRRPPQQLDAVHIASRTCMDERCEMVWHGLRGVARVLSRWAVSTGTRCNEGVAMKEAM